MAPAVAQSQPAVCWGVSEGSPEASSNTVEEHREAGWEDAGLCSPWGPLFWLCGGQGVKVELFFV